MKENQGSSSGASTPNNRLPLEAIAEHLGFSPIPPEVFVALKDNLRTTAGREPTMRELQMALGFAAKAAIDYFTLSRVLDGTLLIRVDGENLIFSMHPSLLEEMNAAGENDADNRGPGRAGEDVLAARGASEEGRGDGGDPEELAGLGVGEDPRDSHYDGADSDKGVQEG